MWAVLGAAAACCDPRGGLRVYRDWLVLDAIFYVLRSGCQRRMIRTTWRPAGRPTAGNRTWGRPMAPGMLSDDRLRRSAVPPRQESCSLGWVLDAESVKQRRAARPRGGHGQEDHRPQAAPDHRYPRPGPGRGGHRCLGARPARRLRWCWPAGRRVPLGGAVWADAGDATRSMLGPVGWAAQELGLTAEIVRRSDDVKGFKAPLAPLVVEEDVRLGGQVAAWPATSTADHLLRGRRRRSPSTAL